MQPPTARRFGPVAFVGTLACLGVLPLAPEVYLFFGSHADLKYFAPIAYYELLISFLLLAPALFLPRFPARVWVILSGGAMALATLVVGFHAVCYGARWNLAAHTALMQTNHNQVGDFLVNFLSPAVVASMALLSAAFAGCIAANVAAEPPRWRVRIGLFAFGALASAHGIASSVRFGGTLTRRVAVSPTQSIRFVDSGYGKLHPLTFLAMIHFNYITTNRYFLRQYRDVGRHLRELDGARPVPGAAPPRLIVVVIGESSNRSHWSLYGHPRETTPRLDALAPQLQVFTDVISTCTSTVFSLGDMFSVRGEMIPSFPLFSQAGYATHWYSAQFNQGGADLLINSLVASCGEHVYLNGVYDENLERLVSRAAALPGRQLVFAHLFGSHVRYLDRYPRRFDRFKPADDGGPLRSSYDNTILYTDTVLADLIGILQRRHDSSCLLYVSDHAEDVLDSRPDKYLFRDETLATNPMYEVPFFAWFSPEYIRDNGAFVAKGVAAARNRRFQDRELYLEIMDLARLRHPLYDPRASLFSPDFVERVRRVGVMGRVYRGAPGVVKSAGIVSSR